jgi:hypothetical protein
MDRSEASQQSNIARSDTIMKYEQLSKQSRDIVNRILHLRSSLPQSMLAKAEKRTYSQYSVADASDAALYLYEQANGAGAGAQ